MKLNQLRDNLGARKEATRVGRGMGSGKGKTAGRGTKGYKARSGSTVGAFEGGQMPLYMRLPKRGFNNVNRVEYEVVNLSMLQKMVDGKKLTAGATVGKKELQDLGLIRKESSLVKLLAKGALKAKLILEVDAASKAAVDALTKTGGAVKLLGA